MVSHPRWVCGENVNSLAVHCEGCTVWAHIKCVGVEKSFVSGLENAKYMFVSVRCNTCKTVETKQKQIMISTITLVTEEVQEMKKKMEEEAKEMKEEIRMLKDELKQMKAGDDIAAPVNVEKVSYAAATKNALILKSEDDVRADEKVKSITDVLADIPIDAVKKKTNGSIVLNFQKKGNLEKAKNAIESDENLKINAKVGNLIRPKIMLTYVEDFDEDDDDNEC